MDLHVLMNGTIIRVPVLRPFSGIETTRLMSSDLLLFARDPQVRFWRETNHPGPFVNVMLRVAPTGLITFDPFHDVPANPFYRPRR